MTRLERASGCGLVDQVATTKEVKQFNDLFRAIHSRRRREELWRRPG